MFLRKQFQSIDEKSLLSIELVKLIGEGSFGKVKLHFLSKFFNLIFIRIL
jgi:hypothetical protein